MSKLSIILKMLIFDHVTYTKQKNNYKGRRIFFKNGWIEEYNTENGFLMKHLPILRYFFRT